MVDSHCSDLQIWHCSKELNRIWQILLATWKSRPPNAAEMFFLFDLWRFRREGMSNRPMCDPGILVAWDGNRPHIETMGVPLGPRAEPTLHAPIWGPSWAYMIWLLLWQCWAYLEPVLVLRRIWSYFLACNCCWSVRPHEKRLGTFGAVGPVCHLRLCMLPSQCRLRTLKLVVTFFSLQVSFSFQALCKLITEQLFDASLRSCFEWA